MTLPGGAANKLGNRYEKWWTLSQLVRMLQGETEALRIEAPGVDKAEFVVTTDRRRELHQAKRDHPNEKWSLAALRTDGLLEAIGRQLRDNDDRFVFASASRAGELADLCEAAKDAESMDEFQGKFLEARDKQKNFKRLLAAWACDAAAAHAILRRIEVHTIDESELEQKVRLGLQALFLTNPNQLLETLRGIVDDSVHRTITRQGLVDDLLGRGYRLRRLTSPQSAGVAVRAATDRYPARRTGGIDSPTARPAGGDASAAVAPGRHGGGLRPDRRRGIRQERLRGGDNRRSARAGCACPGLPARPFRFGIHHV